MSYAYWDALDGHGPGADDEALDAQRLDADMEQAAMERAGNAIARARKAGRCTHGSVQGYRGGPRSAQQEGLKPGQLRCTDTCGTVFGSDEEWYAAMDEAVYGDA